MRTLALTLMLFITSAAYADSPFTASLLEEGNVRFTSATNDSYTVSPKDCVKFGRGESEALTLSHNHSTLTLTKSTVEALGEEAFQAPEGLPLRFCHHILHVGASASKTFISTDIANKFIRLTPEFAISPLTTHSKYRTAVDNDSSAPLTTHYTHDNLSGALSFPLEACYNPDFEGNVLISEGKLFELFPVSEVEQTEGYSQIMTAACTSLAILITKAPKYPTLNTQVSTLLQQSQ